MKYIIQIIIVLSLFIGGITKPMNLAYSQMHPNELKFTNGLKKHNDAILKYLKNPKPILIWANSYHVATDGSAKINKKEITINNNHEIINILQKLILEKLSYEVDSNGNIRIFGHCCKGNIKIEFNINGKLHLISFDHGEGITSSLVDGYHNLEANQAAELVIIFKNYGFTDNELGL